VSNGWPLVPMEDIFEIARGGSPRPIDSFLTDDPDGVNWVMISDATESGKYINSTKKRIREEGVKRSRVVQPGDFLLTNSMSFGRPYIMNTSGCIHDGWLVLSPRNQNVSPDFFYHLLGSNFVYSEFVRRAAGATVKNLNIELVKSVQVPLPPMSEQRRIAEVLDRAEALRAKRRAALSELDALTQSIFMDLFGDPRENRSRCSIVPLGELCVKLVDGTHKTPTYTASGVPFITVRNMVTGTLNFEGTKFIGEDEHAILTRHVRPERGDILVSKDGTIGVACPVETDRAFSIFVSVALLKIKHDIVDHLFLTGQFRTDWIQSQIRAGTKGIAIRHLHLNDFKKLRVLLPALTLQKEFVRRVVAVEKLRTTHRSWLDEMDTLFAVLQHRAFRGEL
jgi:type I restriction enzyme S subunit